MLSIKNPKILKAIEEALKTKSFVPLEKTTPHIYHENQPMTVFVGKDPEGRIKTIIVKDEIFAWVLNLEIISPKKKLCEMWDFGRFSPIGFEGKLLYKNLIGSNIVAGSHYHMKKKELFFVLSKRGKLTFSFTCIKDGEKVSIELDSSSIEVGGMHYSLALYLTPGVVHEVANHQKTGSVLLAVVADRSHDSSDDYRPGND